MALAEGTMASGPSVTHLMPTLAVALLPTHLIPASAGLLMATLALEAVSALMVSWASLARLVLVPALPVPALIIRPVVTSALAAVLWLAMMEGVGAAWWPVVVHADWWLAAV